MIQHLSILFTVLISLASTVATAEEVSLAGCEKLAKSMQNEKFVGKDVQQVLHYLRAQNVDGLEAEVVHPGETGQTGLVKPRMILTSDPENKFVQAHCG